MMSLLLDSLRHSTAVLKNIYPVGRTYKDIVTEDISEIDMKHLRGV